MHPYNGDTPETSPSPLHILLLQSHIALGHKLSSFFHIYYPKYRTSYFSKREACAVNTSLFIWSKHSSRSEHLSIPVQYDTLDFTAKSSNYSTSCEIQSIPLFKHIVMGISPIANLSRVPKMNSECRSLGL